MRPIFFLIIFVCPLLSLSAQSLKAYLKAANQAYDQKDYYAAMIHYENALEETQSSDIQYQYAQSARQFYSYSIAAEYYKKVQNSKDALRYSDATYWLAQVQKQQGKYKSARDNFERYARSRGAKKDLQKLAQSEMKNCEWALQKIADPIAVEVAHLEKKINTPYSEFGAILRNDTLYYSSYRFENEEDKQYPPRKISKTLTSIKEGKGRIIGRGFNSLTEHTANVTFSQNGSRMYFTRCQNLENSQIRCQLYYVEKDRRNRWKKTAIKLPEYINQAKATTTHPSIGYDSLLQKEVLYFASNRTGGQGGLDIWKTIIEEGTTFSRPENQTFLNTSKDDLTPFFYTPKQILYFSTDGRQGLGGYDIFKYSIGTDSTQINPLKYPINTSYNDLYYAPTADSMIAYLSSNRTGAFYLDKRNEACCNDIFKITYLADKEELVEIIVEEEKMEEVSSEPTEKPTVTKPKIPQTLADFLPLALYFDNDEPDRRTRRISTKKTYMETFVRYMEQQEIYQKNYVEDLPEEDQITAVEEIDNFFINKIQKGKVYLERFSEILLQRLETGDKVEIFLKGFTSPRAKSDYNLNLSQRRISSVRNHFSEWNNGVFGTYLEKDQLIISERPFGETTAQTRVSDDLDDQRNSIYSPTAARERRVEIVELGIE